MLRPALALVPLIALALPAHAAVLDTPPGFAGTGANVQCLVRSFDSKVRTVTVTILDAVGAEVEGPLTAEVAPGSTIDLLNTGGTSTYVTCRFEGLTRKVRCWLTVIDSGGTRVMLPAAR